MRHLVMDCSYFAQCRRAASTFYALQPGWLEALPRVAVKSGWITFSADPSLDVRSRMQCAICRIALTVQEAVTTVPH